ncbi:hypothetical protein [uncultured Faecalibaculum sp.]|nr:hypothetical protein [uncultured Faecalibaculum sp.]
MEVIIWIILVLFVYWPRSSSCSSSGRKSGLSEWEEWNHHHR